MIWAVLIILKPPQTTTQYVALKCAFDVIRLLLGTCGNHS